LALPCSAAAATRTLTQSPYRPSMQLRDAPGTTLTRSSTPLAVVRRHGSTMDHSNRGARLQKTAPGACHSGGRG
jgi:hypothetical protein